MTSTCGDAKCPAADLEPIGVHDRRGPRRHRESQHRFHRGARRVRRLCRHTFLGLSRVRGPTGADPADSKPRRPADNARALLTQRQDQTRFQQTVNNVMVDVQNALITLQQDRPTVTAAQRRGNCSRRRSTPNRRNWIWEPRQSSWWSPISRLWPPRPPPRCAPRRTWRKRS